MMLDWLRSLTPETIIIFSFLLVLFILLIFVLTRLSRIASRVGEQEFYLNESLLNVEGEHFINLTIINKAFSTNHINVIGVELRNVSHPLEEKLVMIAPRSKHQTRFNLEDIKRFIFQNKRKYRPFRIYVENEIGLRKSFKPKVNNRFLKREFLKLQKQDRIEKKKKRFETGQYKLNERFGLIVGLLFRPFSKLFRHMALSTNKALRESEIRRLQKKEHDLIKYKLDQDEFELNEIRIKEQAIKENRTRELELEGLKKSKELEIERIKKETRESEFLASKTALESIDPVKVAAEELALENKQDQVDLKKKARKPKKQESEITESSETPLELIESPEEETLEVTNDTTILREDNSVEAKDELIEKPKRKRRKKADVEDVDSPAEETVNDSIEKA